MGLDAMVSINRLLLRYSQIQYKTHLARLIAHNCMPHAVYICVITRGRKLDSDYLSKSYNCFTGSCAALKIETSLFFVIIYYHLIFLS